MSSASRCGPFIRKSHRAKQELNQPPVSQNSGGTAGVDNKASMDSKVSSPHMHQSAWILLLWRCLGLLAIIMTIVTVICVAMAYKTDEWEVALYSDSNVSFVAEANNYSVESYPTYHLLTAVLNSTVTSSTTDVHGKKTTLAISKQITNGLFSVCDTVEGSLKSQMKADGVIWLNSCLNYTSTGPSQYLQNTPERFCHMMTRLSQAYMAISFICITITLILGTFSFILGQVMACVVTATICLASALYLLFTGITMLRRMGKQVSFLDSNLTLEHSIPLESSSVTGQSFTYIWVATATATIGGLLWIVVWRLLRVDIRTLEHSEAASEQNLRYDYNRCCHPYHH